MKRTVVLLAMVMTIQVLAPTQTYAGGFKNGINYIGGEWGLPESHVDFSPIQWIWDAIFPPKEVIKAPPIGTIGGKEANAPSWFSCTGKKGMKLVMDGSVSRTVYCD